MQLSIEYRPCSCDPYVRRAASLQDPRGIKDPGPNAPEFFEVERVAAARFMELLKKGIQPRVHVGDPGRSCLHVKAVTFEGERFKEDG